MNGFLLLNAFAALVLFSWSTWCILSPNFNDGILGKLIFSALSISCFVIIDSVVGGQEPKPIVEMTAALSLAALAIRHWFMVHVWPHVAAAIFHKPSAKR